MSTLPPDVMAELRPHVIDLNRGRLSSGGSFATSDADVVEIFPTHLGVVQYSGHGTQVADIDGDEVSDHLDEALVPVDFGTGAFVIDDDLRSIFSTIPTGANLTCFMDCCFSESNTRLLRVEQPRLGTTGVTARFLPRSDERDRRHREFRDARRTRAVAGGRAEVALGRSGV